MVGTVRWLGGCVALLIDISGEESATAFVCRRLEREYEMRKRTSPLPRRASVASHLGHGQDVAEPAVGHSGTRMRLTVTMTYPDPHGALLQNDMNLIVRAGEEDRAVQRHGNMAAGDQEFDSESKSAYPITPQKDD